MRLRQGVARLDNLPLGTAVATELLRAGSHWRLSRPLDLFSSPHGDGLATQAWAGRELHVLDEAPCRRRLQVQLAEDGYRGWIEPQQLLGRASSCAPRLPQLLAEASIRARIPAVIAFVETAAKEANTYLWGGSLGPNYDCSGLIQRAFAASGIWIPRDAYQQERFCQPVAVRPTEFQLLLPGDLMFFGSPQRCTHVGLHLGDGRYLHSSGCAHGRGGIGVDGLSPHDSHAVASHYRRELRGAGRVQRCHDGSHLP
jgi:cell wall-associated NlpC family hydrolase